MNKILICILFLMVIWALIIKEIKYANFFLLLIILRKKN